ncbi:glutamic acid-rich protein precursor, putative [Entamoeba histolytica HM-1:IMSS]|uniref:Glutamic acid-rich protein, putative n=1 Tax=Entamoeba histolytica (strain ATCC 30459 / HM-1:IMSS / ABRM) TaxID=294381 RepID=B1N369_ENTH1|nr:glutamic acid-rich protein precursor, putative [Entamoeba histolytica HM-1:IMSS]EDS89587.1 glutamic acid-rich protein precursor, putative [Entamoeba histolytica HM-1:IMSS]|eukprot:XP_001913635.1 glutamic acid-rich protein precursor, putative [Entamoeba histolytica HM-1:IMSS]
MINRVEFTVELLRQYRGELTHEKVVRLNRLVKVVEYVHQNHQNEEIVIPSKEVIGEVLDNPNDENMKTFVGCTFREQVKIDETDIKKVYEEQESSAVELLKDIMDVLMNENIKKYVSNKAIKRITQMAQKIRNNIVECINENMRMEEEKKQESTTPEMTNIPISEGNKTEEKEIPKETEEERVNREFEEKMKSLDVELDKIKRKYTAFKKVFEEHGEDVEYLMKQEKAVKECENMIKNGIEVNEMNMKVLMDLDGFVGLNEENRKKRKDLVIQIQDELDEIEGMLKRLRVTKMKVEKRVEEIEKQKQAMEEEEKRKEEEEKEKAIKELKKKKEEEMKRKSGIGKQQNQRYVRPKKTQSEREEESKEEEKAIELEKKSSSERIREMIDWSKLKMSVKFQVSDRGNNVIVYGTIAGLKDEDIDVNITKNGYLKVSGVKKPNDNEMNMIIRTIKQRMGNISDEDLAEIVMKYCTGRFGTFSQLYEIPEDIDIKNITVNYDEGILQVNLPRKQETRRSIYPRFGMNDYNDGYNDPYDSFW